MKTPDEWALEIGRTLGMGDLDRDNLLENPLLSELGKVVERIRREALSNVPPLPQLRVDDERANDLGKLHEKTTGGEWLVNSSGIDTFERAIASFYQAGAADDRRKTAEKMTNIVFCASAHRDVPDLLADRETLLRMLGDCDGLEAYQRGYRAGYEKREEAEWVQRERRRKHDEFREETDV